MRIRSEVEVDMRAGGKLLGFGAAVAVAAIVGVGGWLAWGVFQRKSITSGGGRSPAVGEVLDQENGVKVYANGKKPYKSHGKHFAPDGYYYGRKWQCVEFVKRYYYDYYGHEMPDGWGHARSFFDEEVAQGELNTVRGLRQFRNGEGVAPQAGDLLVYVYGEYGHVAIVSKMADGELHLVQQNVAGRVRDTMPMRREEDRWVVGDDGKLAGWLRMP